MMVFIYRDDIKLYNVIYIYIYHIHVCVCVADAPCMEYLATFGPCLGQMFGKYSSTMEKRDVNYTKMSGSFRLYSEVFLVSDWLDRCQLYIYIYTYIQYNYMHIYYVNC